MRTRSIGLAAMFVAAAASGAWAQPYYARGDFNGFFNETDPMTEVTPTHYTHTITGQPAGALQEYKIAVFDWSSSWPGSNGKVAVNAAGEINFHFYPGPSADGWSPAADRVGYEDSGMHGWDIMGSFNGWAEPGVVSLTDMGGGQYSAQITVATPGMYECKIRKEDDWSISVGDDFGNSALNIPVETTETDQEVLFELDLPGGRWRVTVIPGPPPVPTVSEWGLIAMTMLLLTAGTLLFNRRRVAA